MAVEPIAFHSALVERTVGGRIAIALFNGAPDCVALLITSQEAAQALAAAITAQAGSAPQSTADRHSGEI